MHGYDPCLAQRYLGEIARKLAQESPDGKRPLRPAGRTEPSIPSEAAKELHD
jgi:hypothetical protein